MSAPSLLIVRFAAIGDCVMAAWAATAYRSKFPEGRLVWAVEKRCRPVVEEGRLVTSIAEFPRDKWKANRWSPATWADQLRTYGALRKEKFDWGVDLNGHSKSALALRIAKPSKRIAVEPTDAFAKRLNPILSAGPEGEHTVEINHRALSTFDRFEIPKRPVMPGDDSIEGEPKLVTISVGAGSLQKMWPADRWQAVGSALISLGYEVALLGGPDDPKVDLPGARDYVAKLPLAMTMQLVSKSTLHLAADTGTGHMAAAFGVPVISIFGPTNAGKYRPFTDAGRVLQKGPTTADVSVEDVLSAARNFLTEERCASS